MSKDLSKLMSYVLRHAPEHLGLTLDAQGWASVNDLIARAQAAGHALDRAALEAVVAGSDKQRFTLSEDRQRIRAAQGHSVSVSLDLPASRPPDVLFHGTAEGSVAAILSEGIKPGQRRHVHLSLDEKTARLVGSRHGRPVVLRIDAARMAEDGLTFWRADNGVWLTDAVPSHYLAL